jgi:steroid 5-alpha reductase family enzyme
MKLSQRMVMGVLVVVWSIRIVRLKQKAQAEQAEAPAPPSLEVQRQTS